MSKMDKKSKNWGGKRPNSGLPKIEDSRRVSILLAPSDINIAKELGDGSISGGIRLALKKTTKNHM